MKILGSCCYFYSLKTGCLLIGFTDIIFSMANLFISVFPAGATTSSKEFKGIGRLNWTMILSTVSIINSMLLIIGAEFKKPRCLKLWLSIASCIMMIFLCHSLSVDFIPVHMVGDAIALGINIYFWFVVLSLYLEMNAARDATRMDIDVLFTSTDV